MVRSPRRALIALAVAACGDDAPSGSTHDSGPLETCTTRIAYDDVTMTLAGTVTWDGACTSGSALLSNGMTVPSCAIALDNEGNCGGSCTTRIGYGSTWIAAPNHPELFDDIDGRVFWDGACDAAGGDSRATLSNGWQPHFTGANSCAISQRWTNCGGVFENPVADFGCADPGVVRDGERYVASCTSGNAANAFPLYVSTDLVTWTAMGHILPAAARPAWAVSDFWAPEIHQVGSQWVAYWSARDTNGRLVLGAASASDPLGPYTALAQPLLVNANVGLIDASYVDGYLLWKEDGNAQNDPTPIKARPLASDGLAFSSTTTTTLITNDRAWEDNLVEAPFVIERAGSYYLFYSGNAYYDGRYAVGVARASSLLGPYTKAPDPIVATIDTRWVGPGHNSVVVGPGGDHVMIYHAWETGHVNGPGDDRRLLVDLIQWDSDGWPRVFGAPSDTVRPRP